MSPFRYIRRWLKHCQRCSTEEKNNEGGDHIEKTRLDERNILREIYNTKVETPERKVVTNRMKMMWQKNVK